MVSEITFNEAVTFISFSLGALSFGFWLVLGLYWWNKARTEFRWLLLWLSINIIIGQGIRILIQLRHYEVSSLPSEDWARLALNVSYICLGVALLRSKVGTRDR